jgi:3-hydroxy-9,10-secoandrosta-1,3,5(10)-triene-9,17-dione monooxygenase reductase component
MGDDAGHIHFENPFVTPLEQRDPARRLRGRLASPVTVWTSGTIEAPVALTISSILIADGDPPFVFGLMNETTDLWESINTSGAFVVHLLEDRDQGLSDEFAGLRPSPGGPFSALAVEGSEWGPVLTQWKNRAFCKLSGSEGAGHQRLVRGEIERIELDDVDSPLVLYRGRYRSLKPR